jgi:hypothetical protein
MKKAAPFLLNVCIVICLGAAVLALVAYLMSQRPTGPAATESTANEAGATPPATRSVNPASLNRLHVTKTPTGNDSDEELLRLARAWVGQSPEQALTWASRETDGLLRERLVFSILRAWGETDPNAAVDWALAQGEEWRFKRMEAALTGAIRQPDEALAIGRKLLAADPVSGSAYGTALVGALNRGSQFQTAFQLAADVPPSERQPWLEMTFSRWAAEQPQEAMNALSSVSDPESRTNAFRGAIRGWAASDPGTLAAHVDSMSAGADRDYAAGQALMRWAEKDPAAMGEWLNSLPATRIREVGAAWMITRSDGANRSPEVAMLWVQEIRDPSLRHDVLVHVVNEWAQTDANTAWRYVSSANWLSDQENRQAMAVLQRQLAHNRNQNSTSD